MTSWTNVSKNTSSFSNQSKTSSSYTNTSISMTVGLWNALTFPWLESLPWQLPGEGAISWTNTAKS